MVKDKKPNQIRIRIKLSAFDHFLLDKSTKEITKAAEASGCEISGPVPLPVIRKRFDAIKSPFVHSRHKSQYDLELHRRLIDVYNPSPVALSTLQKLDVPAGINAEIKMVQ